MKGGAKLDGLNANPILTLDPNKEQSFNKMRVSENLLMNLNKAIVFSQKTNGEQITDIETYTSNKIDIYSI